MSAGPASDRLGRHDRPAASDSLFDRLAARGAAEIGAAERAVCASLGGLLVKRGVGMIFRRTVPGLLLSAAGGYLLYRGATGHSRMYEAAGAAGDPATFSNPFWRTIQIRESVRILWPADELYDYWRDFVKLPETLKHVERVEQLDDHHYRWHFRALDDRPVTSHVVVTDERPGELIAWTATDESDIDHRGRIEFRPAPGQRGTIVRVSLTYRPPGGAVGVLLAKALGRDPAQQARADLGRFKQMIEAGEICTNASTSARSEDRARAVTTSPCREQRAAAEPADEVTVASQESFPASDPPGWSPTRP